VKTDCRYRIIQIQAGDLVITVADSRPDYLRAALTKTNRRFAERVLVQGRAQLGCRRARWRGAGQDGTMASVSATLPRECAARVGHFIAAWAAAWWYQVPAIGCVRFFRDVGSAARPATRSDWLQLAGDLVLLRWMEGGGGGCYYPDPDEPSTQRRWLHQAMAGGFVSAFLATIGPRT
jgi:hypothetical protein